MSAVANGGQGPGALLEAARRKQGLHIAALAAQLKVPPSRLEALEAERWDELPDPTHARALATSVCRVLGVDAAPVLAGMPRGAGAALERVSAGLNQPVRTHEGLRAPGLRWALAGVALLLAIALGIFLWPGDLQLQWGGWREDAPPAAAQVPGGERLTALPQASEPLPAAEPSTPTPVSVSASTTPALVAEPAASTVAASGGALLEIRASQGGASWVSVVDGSGKNLASRLLQSGELLSLQVQAPVRLILGNAPALSLSWRGQPQPLQGYEQVRVAKLQLK